MKSISSILNIMIKASERASKVLIRDFGEIENLQVSRKGPTDFVTNADIKAEKIRNFSTILIILGLCLIYFTLKFYKT